MGTRHDFLSAPLLLTARLPKAPSKRTRRARGTQANDQRRTTHSQRPCYQKFGCCSSYRQHLLTLTPAGDLSRQSHKKPPHRITYNVSTIVHLPYSGRPLRNNSASASMPHQHKDIHTHVGIRKHQPSCLAAWPHRPRCTGTLSFDSCVLTHTRRPSPGHQR